MPTANANCKCQTQTLTFSGIHMVQPLQELAWMPSAWTRPSRRTVAKPTSSGSTKTPPPQLSCRPPTSTRLRWFTRQIKMSSLHHHHHHQQVARHRWLAKRRCSSRQGMMPVIHIRGIQDATLSPQRPNAATRVQPILTFAVRELK